MEDDDDLGLFVPQAAGKQVCGINSKLITCE